MRYKHVIFDQDGTIANTLKLIATAITNTIEHFSHKKYTPEYIIRYFLGPSEDGFFQQWLPEQPEEAFLYYVEEYKKLHGKIAPRPFDGIGEMLAHLQNAGVHVYMMTGKHAMTTDITLNRYDIRKYFEVVVTGSPKGAVKVEALTKMVQDLHLNMEDCVYVGDEDRDINYCREIGMPVVSAAWAESALPEVLEKLNPGRVFYRPSDLEKWLLV